MTHAPGRANAGTLTTGMEWNGMECAPGPTRIFAGKSGWRLPLPAASAIDDAKEHDRASQGSAALPLLLTASKYTVDSLTISVYRRYPRPGVILQAQAGPLHLHVDSDPKRGIYQYIIHQWLRKKTEFLSCHRKQIIFICSAVYHIYHMHRCMRVYRLYTHENWKSALMQ